MPRWLNFLGRKFTVIVDINSGKPGGKVSFEEYADFLTDDLGVDPLWVTQLEVHSLTGMLMVRLSSDEQKEAVLAKLEVGVSWPKYGSTVWGWDSAASLTRFKLLNVPKRLIWNG